MAYTGLKCGKESGVPEMFVIPEKEFTPEFYNRPSGPIRMKVIEHDPEGPGFRWMWKEGTDMLRSFVEGDEITISQEMRVDLLRAGLQFSWAVGNELMKMQQPLSFTKSFEVGRKIKFVAKRVDRFRVFLHMTFEGDPEEGMWNLVIPRMAGFCFIEPDSQELSIMDAPEDVLSNMELAVRGLVEEAGFSEMEAVMHTEVMMVGMAKYGIIFYRP